jgi:hypothetical protein
MMLPALLQRKFYAALFVNIQEYIRYLRKELLSVV